MPYVSMAFDIYLHGIRLLPLVLFCFIIFLDFMSSLDIKSKLERMLVIAYVYYALVIFLLLAILLVSRIS